MWQAGVFGKGGGGGEKGEGGGVEEGGEGEKGEGGGGGGAGAGHIRRFQDPLVKNSQLERQINSRKGNKEIK